MCVVFNMLDACDVYDVCVTYVRIHQYVCI